MVMREQSDEATQTLLIELNCSAEPVIGRAFARPVGSKMTSNLTPCLLRFAEIGPIGQSNSILKRGACAPAQFRKPADIEQLVRRAVGPRGVEGDLAGISDSRSHQSRELCNRDVLAGADIDQTVARIILHQ